MTVVARSLLSFCAIAALLAPGWTFADRAALTLELGGSLVGTRLAPTVGRGGDVQGTLGGAELRVRYALSNRLEVQVGGFWDRTATFVNTSVTASAGAGPVTGDLRRDLGRKGAAAGVRYVLLGSVWRMPLGLEAGWLRTAFTNQDLLDRTDPGRPVSFGVRIDSTTCDRLFVAPFAGLEWAPANRLSVSIIPRLELPLGGASSAAFVVPLAVGWSWYLL